MSNKQPALAKGTRDFGPTAFRKRQYIFDTLRSIFEKYGFQPIETPAIEQLTTLEGKYGEEADKLMFRILNSGDYLKDVPEDLLRSRQSSLVTKHISEKGLRYDLTIPFARYVVMHQHQITFPFKRYQIQPVWRADRPQKGRYREFYQCDADVIGSDSLLNEVELLLIYQEAFQKLGIPAEIVINNRKILTGLAEILDISDRAGEFILLLDKLDKVGKESIAETLRQRHFPAAALDILEMSLQTSDQEQLAYLKQFLAKSQIGCKGLEEVEFVLEHVSAHFQLTLARGLDYYTGLIFEAKALNVHMGSIGGGGRYDNLTGIFGLEGVSGVGISFGIERIYDIMDASGLFKHIEPDRPTTRILFIHFEGEAAWQAFDYVRKIRQQQIPAEIYPSPVKMEKQMKYAHAYKIPFVAFVGEEERKKDIIRLKNMKTGEQTELTFNELVALLQSA